MEPRTMISKISKGDIVELKLKDGTVYRMVVECGHASGSGPEPSERLVIWRYYERSRGEKNVFHINR